MNGEMTAAVPFTSHSELLEMFEGDAAFVDELTQAFLNLCPLAIKELHAGVIAGDPIAVARTAHSLKGTMGYFDDGAGMEALHRLEQMTDADLPSAHHVLRGLELRLGELTRFLTEGRS
jgi:HPt (histidine-containing phosphotransfer) domain-containing protein